MTFTVLYPPSACAVISTNCRTTARRIALLALSACIVGYDARGHLGNAWFLAGASVQRDPGTSAGTVSLQRDIRVHGFCPLPRLHFAPDERRDYWNRISRHRHKGE